MRLNFSWQAINLRGIKQDIIMHTIHTRDIIPDDEAVVAGKEVTEIGIIGDTILSALNMDAGLILSLFT